MELEALKSGVIIEDPFFPEPVKIIQVQPLENGAIQIQGVGTVERKFYDPVLKDFSGKLLFPPRKVFTPRFELNLGYDIRSEIIKGMCAT